MGLGEGLSVGPGKRPGASLGGGLSVGPGKGSGLGPGLCGVCERSMCGPCGVHAAFARGPCVGWGLLVGWGLALYLQNRARAGLQLIEQLESI